MRTILQCNVPRKAIKVCPGRGRALSGPLTLSLTQRVAMPSLSLHRISVVRVNLSIAFTTYGSLRLGSASPDFSFYPMNLFHEFQILKPTLFP